ncbi:hypothetical protein BV22DRAFT_1072404 [Leucogyrophana mollusca]|uniref:Uncharacterized protein n=1 Tax=Leucogyrophana mollusca TaxID=85980 RepID=A0ACB8B6I3_9AGAM|nr:hypothetical protein BV22DRAFT_1072404 [Leucogyrophana mollusca]
MPSFGLQHVTQAIISSFREEEFEVSLEKLQSIFPDATIVAALDLVDRGNVIKYTTAWGRCHYEVLGSTATYTVFPSLFPSTSVSSYCTCPAFAFSVLMAESHLMCKHVLASCLAEQLSRCVERPISDEELVAKMAGNVY